MKILLVDDDTAIIRSVLAILRTLPGHEIRAATSGAKALENAGAMGGPDLLITDVVMEGMDGFALRDTLLARFPALRVLFITGYDLSDHAAQIGDAPVLQKPFEDQALLAAIETASAPPAVEPVAVHPEPPPAPVPAPLPVAKPVSIPRVRAVAVSEEDITGAKVGPYQVLRKLGQGKWGSVYEALQISMGRNVALKVLSPRLQSDPVARSRFIADASAKARVQHPFILSVYEAGEADGYCFYTHEMVEGRNLAEVQAAGDHIDEPAALQVIRVAAEGLSYLNQHKIPHDPIQSASLYFGSDQRPRLANLATVDSTPQETPQEIRSLAEIALAVLPQGRRASAAFQAMLARMQAQGPAGFASWGALLQEVKTLEPKVIPVDAFKLNAQEQAAIRAVEEARKRQKMQIVWSVVGIVLLIWAVVGAVWWAFFRTNERNLDVQVMIPAGPFIYQEGEKLTLPAFSIDKYEVTFGDYAKFLADLERNPTTQYDHPRQPVGKSHKPDDWDIYLGRARWNKPVTAKEGGGFAPIDLNCPVFKVDYWDAYAYAKWKGRRLPTEQEWEKAARGTQGFLYPWGNQFDPKKCDSRQSGIGHWIAVDANSEDRSPFGVIGMAGNVAEWTDSWDAGHKFPVIRGGSYHSPDCKLTDRVTEADPETAHEFLGFRTVSDVPASKP